MKVETDLKAGQFLQDVAQTASNAAGQVSGFFSKAGEQATGLTSAVVDKTTALWNCLAG